MDCSANNYNSSDDVDKASSVCVSDNPLSPNKRGLENGGELGCRSEKKAKGGAGEMQRAAEIILVLSAMSGMRGGRSPTEAEVKLMEEAKAILVEICGDLRPKDLVAKDAIGNVIDDLGLNWKLKDQRLGQFRGPTARISIKDKVYFAKKKMEDSKKFATYTSQMSQPNFGATNEVRGPSHSIRMFPADKPSNSPLHSGGLPTSSATGHVPAATSTPVTHHPIASEVRSISNSHLGRDLSVLSTPKVEKANFKMEGGSNGASHAPQVQVNTFANQSSMNPPKWTFQSPSLASNKATTDNKVLQHGITKAEGTTNLTVSQAAPQAFRDQAFRSLITQNTSANLQSINHPVQGMKYVQPPSVLNNHNEIAKVVQKFLHPKLPEYPTWNPPSRDYMNKPLTCQMCKVAATEVETVVLCDACEKGFHLKCLEAMNQKGIPRGGEWHCLRCISLSNGKPLPPKYGRVMRSITPPKGPSNPAGAPPSLDKKNFDKMVNQEKSAVNGSSGLQSPAGVASDSKTPNSMEVIENNVASSVNNMDQRTSVENLPNMSTKTLGAAVDSLSGGLSSDSSIQMPQVLNSCVQVQDKKSVSESKSQPPAMLSETITKESDSEHPRASNSLRETGQSELSKTSEVPIQSGQDGCMVNDSKNIGGGSNCPSTSHVNQSEQDVSHANSVGSCEAKEDSRRQASMYSDGARSIEWIGDVLKITDGKKFYELCSVDGVTYKVQGHALIRFSHEKLIPSKLQAMWEEIATGSKWITVSQCYFPCDLPEAVGHPCGPESNEVYESNHERSIMAGLIQGPCEVLTHTEFQGKLGNEGKNESPVFLCKWFYDASKGNFQPVFS